MAWPGDTFACMQAVRRLAAGGDPGIIADAGLGIAGAGLIAVAAWGQPRLIGSEAIAGPTWLLAVLPLLLGGPLVLRRRAPLLMWLATWAGIALLFLFAGNSGRGLAFTFVVLAAAYSLGAHASFRRAVAGLVITFPVVAVISDRGELGLVVGKEGGGGPAVILALLQLVAFWLAGVLVHARRGAVSLAERSADLQRQAKQATAAERARIARELHDIVGHHLSVIVLQAAGARASGKPAGAVLEKIENSARQALEETSRLLDVLRDPAEEAGLAPQPAIGELGALAASVRAAGLPVNLVVDGNLAALPAVVDVSVYRIVQEALTNVLKHAGPARAEVMIGREQDTVTIEVTDNGTGQHGNESPGGGHGLAGMRERAAVFGGELAAGPRPGGGFTVRARLPLSGHLPAGEPA
ncbi:MAG: Two component signal transduction histidine kinase, dimerization and phosphoacceptor region [Actinomycetia bacterium]|nr:Two component signal transduction histidine kinase, dimerization and phosphoacceptor region [Actinomycetes bacterium]